MEFLDSTRLKNLEYRKVKAEEEQLATLKQNVQAKKDAQIDTSNEHLRATTQLKEVEQKSLDEVRDVELRETSFVEKLAEDLNERDKKFRDCMHQVISVVDGLRTCMERDNVLTNNLITAAEARKEAVLSQAKKIHDLGTRRVEIQEKVDDAQSRKRKADDEATRAKKMAKPFSEECKKRIKDSQRIIKEIQTKLSKTKRRHEAKKRQRERAAAAKKQARPTGGVL